MTVHIYIFGGSAVSFNCNFFAMGNANGREEEDESLSLTETGRSNGGEMGLSYNHAQVPGRVASSESMGNIDNNNNNTPPHSPGRSPSPLLFAPQVSFSLLFFFFSSLFWVPKSTIIIYYHFETLSTSFIYFGLKHRGCFH